MAAPLHVRFYNTVRFTGMSCVCCGGGYIYCLLCGLEFLCDLLLCGWGGGLSEVVVVVVVAAAVRECCRIWEGASA